MNKLRSFTGYRYTVFCLVQGGVSIPFQLGRETTVGNWVEKNSNFVVFTLFVTLKVHVGDIHRISLGVLTASLIKLDPTSCEIE